MRNAVLHTFERDFACRSSMRECLPCNSHRFGHPYCRCQVLRITSVACEIFMLFVFQRNTHPHTFVLRLRRRPQYTCINCVTTSGLHTKCIVHHTPLLGGARKRTLSACSAASHFPSRRLTQGVHITFGCLPAFFGHPRLTTIRWCR